jgi:hypothetical protein
MQRLPRLTEPVRYTGLYVFDFGDSVSVGYTADEIAVLLESGRYPTGRAYKIHRAYADGRLEMKGVSLTRLRGEDGLFFYRREPAAARGDYDELSRLADAAPPPCRCELQLARVSGAEYPNVVAIIYPAEHSDDISAWLTRIGYAGGDTVEAGISQLTCYYGLVVTRLDERQLRDTPDRISRSAEEVLATTHLAVQR